MPSLLGIVLAFGAAVAWTETAAAAVAGVEEVQRGKPGDFGIYILALSWKPDWCFKSSFPGCTRPHDFWKDHLTVHGLWPDYGDGSYPTHCTSEAFDAASVEDDIGMDELLQYWPNVQQAEGGNKYASFWSHEWTKHGTCTGLSQQEYFSAALDLIMTMGTPSAITDNIGGKVSREDVEEGFGGEGMAVLTCDAGKYLNQVNLCFTVKPDSFLPDELIACPAAVVAHDDTCKGDEVYIDAWSVPGKEQGQEQEGDGGAREAMRSSFGFVGLVA